MPIDESERLDAVDRLNILDTEPEAAFDRIAEVAQQVFGVQGAGVSIVEEDRQWFKATCGLNLDQTPREKSICTHVVEGDGVMVVEDAREDPRFRENSLLKEEGIRFYAGAPLSIDDCLYVGTLCVTDPAPQSFGEEDRALLAQLASMATNLLQARLQTYETSYLTSALEQVDEPVSIIEGNPEAPSDARLAWANEAYAARSGTTQPALDGTRPWIFENLAADSEAEDRVCRALDTGESVRGETSGRRENGELRTFAWVLAPVRDDEQITHWVIVQRDVTEQRRAQQALRTHRDRLQRMQEVAQIGGWEYYPEADAFAGSKQLYHLLGLPEDTDFDLERAFQFYPPAVRDRVKTATRRCLDDGAPFDLEVPLVAATDQHREVRIRGAARREEGRTIRMTGTIQDITARKQRERHLRQANILFEHAQEAFLLFDLDPAGDELNFTVQRVNPAYEQMSGRRADDVRGLSVQEIHGDEHGSTIASHLRRCAERREPTDWDMQLPTGGDTTHWDARAAPVLIDDEVQQVAVTLRDVTERKNREEDVRKSRERWRQLAESHRDPIQITVGETIQYVNPAGAKLYGASDPSEIVGRSVLEFVPDDEPGDPSDVEQAMQTRREAFRRDGESPPLEYEIRRLDGERRVVEFYSVLIRYKGQEATQTVVRDVTEQRLREAQLKHEAAHDQLTGLLRDSDLRKRVRWALTNPGERDGALLYIDLDRFKEVNDNLGHHVGDAVLIEAAERLRNVVRETDAVGRAGGDEFVIWSSPLPDEETAVTMARRVAETLQRPYEVEDHRLQVGASVGLVTDGSGYTDVESLIQNADAAMYRAKTSSTQSVVRHGSARGEEDDLSLEAAIRRGVERDAFEPFLLPVVRLDDGALTGFEVLARWRRENGHLATPDTFLDVAEDTGMIVPIGRRVIEDACRGLQSLRENKTLDLSMTLSGNFSRQEFFRDETCNFIRRLLDTYDLSPSDFTMEITERIVENGGPDDTAVAKFKSLGINIEVDDLGTGYSSLHSLLKFPADGLKIDKELTAKVASSDAAHAIAQSVIEMAQSLDLHVTAEGIETAEQLSVLRDLGCQYGQGYLFSEPVPVGEAEALAHTFPRDLSSP